MPQPPIQKIGRYQITRELGRGAMGVVYHAIDPTIGRAVAIKTLRLRDVDDVEQRRRLRERLFREARSAGALSHPGIVTIYDMDDVDGLAYIAMEFVDGHTLEEVLNRPQALPKERVTEILRQAAAALDYAHRKGVVHRDIKPANIMIDLSGAVKITDFGIAKITQFEGQTLTGVLVGTPNYMSPEQVQGHEIDGRSDQFSLGVIAYEMLTGERPFYGEQISTVVYKIVAEQPVGIQNVNTTLNEGVDKVLRKALGKKPERRFAACTGFTTALDAALGATKGWRVLPRRAHENLATAATAAASFKPIRKAAEPKRPAPPQSPPLPRVTQSIARKRGMFFFPLLAGLLVLAALLFGGAWRAGLVDRTWIAKAFEPAQQPKLPEKPQENLQEKPPANREATPPSSGEPESETPHGVGVQSEAPKTGGPMDSSPATAQDIQVITDPPGVRAQMEEAMCQTPCRLSANTGVHTLTVAKEGYLTERREVRVGHQDVDLPLISLRSSNGILLLTSDPSGANVIVDGQVTDQKTPVRISLPTGMHSVAIEKNGLGSSDQVEIRSGDLSTLKLTVKRQ